MQILSKKFFFWIFTQKKVLNLEQFWKLEKFRKLFTYLLTEGARTGESTTPIANHPPTTTILTIFRDPSIFSLFSKTLILTLPYELQCTWRESRLLPAKLIDKLQRIQFKFDHISDALQRLHWLPIRFRIQFKVLLCVYKSIRDIGPTYLSEMISVYEPARRLRSGNKFLLSVGKYKTNFGKRSFQFSGPSLFNSMPEHIRVSAFNDEIDCFKRNLKTHLFTLAF